MDTAALIRAARGVDSADLLFVNARIANVLTGELLFGEVAVLGDWIAYVGEKYPGDARETVDLGGACLSPGLIDAHCHVESSMVTPAVYTREAARFGTTTFVTDPHEIANVAGLDGIRFMLESTEALPVRYYVQAPSCVPSTPFEHAGAVLRSAELAPLLEEARVLGLGEMMNYPGVAACDADILELLGYFSGRVIDGHAPGLGGAELQGYLAAGIETDHESVSWAEAREKLRAGAAVLVREGSASQNLEAILTGLLHEGLDSRRLAFCTDDRHLSHIRREGTIRHNVKKAVTLGLPPVTALQMATINAAQIYRLRRLGAIAPGFLADLVIFEDLRDFVVRAVYTGGRLCTPERFPAPKVPDALCQSVHLAPLTAEQLALPRRALQPVLGICPGQIATTLDYVPEDTVAARLADGSLRKILVAERHRATGCVGVGLIAGYGLRHGAIASTVAHDSHNIIAVGDNDSDLLCAIRALERVGGGYTLAVDGAEVGTLPLPVCGLMSTEPAERFLPVLEDMLQKARDAGVAPGIDPYTTLSFMALPVIPEARITDLGVFDVGRFAFIE